MKNCTTCHKPAVKGIMCPRCSALNDMMNAYYSFVGHADYFQFVTEKLLGHTPHSTDALERIATETDNSRLRSLAQRIAGIQATYGTGNLVPTFLEMIKRRIEMHPTPKIAV